MSKWPTSQKQNMSWIEPICLGLVALLMVLPGCGPRDQDAAAPETVVTEESTEVGEVQPPAEGEIQEEAIPPEGAGAASASATIEARSGSTLSGTAVFEETSDGVRVVVELSGLTPGDHGVHVHEVGDCSAEDASSAGGHFNPTGVDHGAPGSQPHHAGDFGNITIGEDGTGTLELTSKDITLGEGANSIRGRAIVIHGGADDLTSQPSGAAGPRIGCGVIQ